MKYIVVLVCAGLIGSYQVHCEDKNRVSVYVGGKEDRPIPCEIALSAEDFSLPDMKESAVRPEFLEVSSSNNWYNRMRERVEQLVFVGVVYYCKAHEWTREKIRALLTKKWL